MINRQLFTMKFNSSRLKKYDYNIKIDYEQALDNGEIIKLADNQILRSIRDVIADIDKRKERVILDRDMLEDFYTELEKVRRSKSSDENIAKAEEIKGKITNMCFIPEYITIRIEDDSHYDYLYEHGLKINEVCFFRLSTSAGQGRVSTVVFCSNDVLESLNNILDNGRDKTVPFSPSKFNAYKGTYGSATKVVTTPRFCVVPDYESPVTFDVNWVTETSGEIDDIIEDRSITKQFNRWDGMGLISPEMAQTWSTDLGLDYIPSQFCTRQSYLKGMFNVFPIHEFCELKNNGSYIVTSVYKDKDGNDIKVDLREIDVIVTEGQFKLWKSYISLESYQENCIKNNLKWGVSLYTDKQLNNTLKMNYQFLQALDIKKEDIPELCSLFENWIQGVNSKNIWYVLLFLMGIKTTKSSIESYIKKSTNYWMKSLIVNHDLINDKYIKQKIYKLIKTKIDNGCMGSLILEGNNQTLVSDPYGMMEYVCGLEVKGLLGADRYYSNYWNEKDVKEIVGMRPPLTYRSECLKMQLEDTEEQRYWYRHSYGGIIVNMHGHETDNWAGSDFDYDFLSTTSNVIVRKSVFMNEYPVCYEAPKPKKIIFTDEDLFKSDKFTFGSKIGAITNKSTTGAAILKDLERMYGKDSREYKVTLNRIKMCTKLQSAQIDKAKIGKEVKGIPRIWTDRKYVDSLDISDEDKEFYKRIMLDRYPYFFIHLYPDTKKKYKKHIEGYDLSSRHKFGIGIVELLEKEDKSDEELSYIEAYHKYVPVLCGDSVMNNICRYIENIDFEIKKSIQTSNVKDIHLILMRNEYVPDSDIYQKILKSYKDTNSELRKLSNIKSTSVKNKFDESRATSVNRIYSKFKVEMSKNCSDVYELTDYLINIFYVDFPNSNKDLLWNTYGNCIFKNIKDKNSTPVQFPIPDAEGTINYLEDKFLLKEVTI